MRTLVAVMIVGLAACNGGGPPDPQPTPTPPYTDECQNLINQGFQWCHEIGQQCGDCLHNPSTDPRHCELAPACPNPEPTPTPSPGECAQEAELVPTTCGGAVYNAAVKQATIALGDLTGNPPQENLKVLAAEITEQTGRKCIFAGVEAIFLLRPDGKYEENHAVYFGDGGWTGNGFGKFIGCHNAANPSPPPTVCTDPDPRGLRAEFVLKKHHQDWDSTYKIRNREYCHSVCSPLEPDVCFIRDACPVRFEGDPEREVCEEVMIGDQKWWCDGQPIESNENPAQARCHGHVKTCTEDGVTCAEADW